MDTFSISQPPATAIPVFFTFPAPFSLSSRLGSTPAAWPGLALPCLAPAAWPGLMSVGAYPTFFHFSNNFSLSAAWAADLVFVPGPARPGPVCRSLSNIFSLFQHFSLSASKLKNVKIHWEHFLASMGDDVSKNLGIDRRASP